jgi:hypothetical protein
MRQMQMIGLNPKDSNSILYEKYVNEKGDEKLVLKYGKRLRGYSEPLFYDDRAPLFEYVIDKPPVEFDEDGFSIGRPFAVKVVFYEEIQGVPWNSGPNVYLRLVEAETGKIVSEWPTTKDGCIEGS